MRESGDLSVAVLDAEGNSMAQGSYSVESLTGTAATRPPRHQSATDRAAHFPEPRVGPDERASGHGGTVRRVD